MAHGASCDRVFRAMDAALRSEAGRAEREGIPAERFFQEAFHAAVRFVALCGMQMLTPMDRAKGEKKAEIRKLDAAICEAVNNITQAEWKAANGSDGGRWLPEDGGHA